MNKTELKQNWAKVLSILEQEGGINSLILDTFFVPLTPSRLSEKEGKLYLLSPQSQGSSYYQNTIKIHQDELIPALEQVFGMTLFAEVIDTDRNEEDERDNQQKEDYLNPRYTFESFISGASNRMAYAASCAVADGYTKKFNPLFIYAGSGLGKTHLMHAINHYVIQHKPRKKVLYVSAETFTTELQEAIHLRKQSQFRDKYRKVDYLLFDDVQFIAKYDFVKEELFNTFEALYNSGKQMVFTSDRPPKELGDIPERLTSRFVWGIMVDIQTPDYETRMAILKNKALLENLNVSDNNLIEVFDLIARSIKNNIRELEGAFTRVLAMSSLLGEPITLSLAKNVLSDLVAENAQDITPEKIKKTVAEYYSIKVSDIESKNRAREIAYPRHIAIYLTRTILGLSYKNIAKIYNKKDHTSIMHSCEVIEYDIKTSKDFSNTIDAICRKIEM